MDNGAAGTPVLGRLSRPIFDKRCNYPNLADPAAKIGYAQLSTLWQL